ncbi:MAG: hypothetical protein JMN27_09220 [gamma proteobacterium endosymbiont of Lamellibrachia anaximandri]|nr:hypothetical protein [gamma proteobacterium endosymbiont of Lamellibrachia anaximandri]
MLGASNAQAAVITYTDEATYLAGLATLGCEVASEGFDSPDWLATETFPVPSLTNNGLTWAESDGSTNFLMTTASGLDGSALRTLDGATGGHTDPDGFYLKTDTATTPNSLCGFGAWYKGSQNGSKVTFTTNGGGVGFTGEEATVLTTWKFLGFIDDVGFTTLDARVVDDPANTDVRLIFVDTASIGAPVGTFPAGTLDLSAANYPVNENDGSVNVTVNRTGGSFGAITVDYATSNGTATSGSDYQAINSTLSFAENEYSKVITINLLDDLVYEGSESFTITLSNTGGGATLGTTTTASIDIADNEPPPSPGTLALSTATISLLESGPAVTVTVDRTAGSFGAVTVDYATANDTATSPGDYTAISGMLTFLDGELSKTLTLTPIGDTVWEPSETFTLNLSNVTSATLGLATATVTITDDDTRNAGTLALSAASATLSESGPAITLTVDRSGGSDGTVTVDYATADVTANAPGDYTAINGTLTFLNGELSKTLTLTPIGDTVWEPSEDFTLTLSNVVDASLGLSAATITIADDDTRAAGTLALSAASATLSEGGPAITLTVDRSGGSDGTVSVDYATADVTANAPGDYTALSGTLTFLNGELSKTLTLTPIGDTTWEPSETFTLTLSNPGDATLGLATATVTIDDDDPRNAGILNLSTATESVAENAVGGLTLTVNRTGGSDGTVSVDYVTADGSALQPGDYTQATGTLTFLDGELNKTIPLTLTDDAPGSRVKTSR